MKKVLIILLLLVSFFSLSCAADDKEQISICNEILKDFSYSLTNGYDYSIKQSIGKTIVNENTIIIKINNDDFRAEKTNNTKTLNEYGEEMFTELTTKSYFYKDELIEEVDGHIVKTPITKDEFFKDSLIKMTLEYSKMDGFSYRHKDNQTILKCEILNEDVIEILGEKFNAETLNIEVSFDTTDLTLYYVKVFYEQEKTSTEISLIPYYEECVVTIPQE